MNIQYSYKPSSDDEFSLSSTQQVIWFDQIIRPDSFDYNLGTLIYFDGELDETLFIQALEAVVSHHDALRLRLVDTHGIPRQRFVENRPLPLTIYDFSQDADAESRARQQFHDNFIRPFDLHSELWHSSLFRVSERGWYWQFCCHHLISDGVGLKLVIKAILEHYKCLVNGEALPETAPSYLDFIIEDHAYLNSKLYTRDLEFWHQRYETLPPPLLLPSHSGKPISNEFSKPVIWQLDATLCQKIGKISETHGLSVLHFIYAILACYFSRTTGTEEIVIGIPAHNRKNIKQKSTLGMFSSVIPIRVTVNAEDSILDIMHKAAAELRHCYKHQRIPLTAINQCTQLKQQTGRTQLFDIALSFQPFDVCFNMKEITTTLKRTYRGATCPLSMAIHQYAFYASASSKKEEKGEQTFSIEFNYDRDYLNYEEVIALQSRLALLTEVAAISPEITVTDVPLLTETERQNVLFNFNKTESEFPQNALIHELFEQQVVRTPEAPAVVYEELTLSYDELNRRANQLAHYLIELGVKPDDRVAICAERSPELIIGLLAILKAGGAYVPLDPTYPADRLAYMLDDATPIMLLTQAAHRANLPETVPVCVLDAPDISLNTRPTHNPDVSESGLTPHHLAYVIYTSGSTGQPKGVMVEHGNVVSLIMDNGYADIGSDDCIAHCANIAFDASTWEIWSALLNGGRLRVIPQAVLLNPIRFRDALIHGKVTAMLLTTGLFNAYLETLAPLFRQLRYLLVGGDVLDPGKIQQLQLSDCQPARLVNCYGPTEITVIATTCPLLSPVDGKRTIPIGRPIANTQVYLLDPQGHPVPLGVEGEIYLGGVGVARGYLNRPELTAECFLSDPFSAVAGARMYKTGDLGRWLPDGNIEYLGRNDFQVKLRGFRIELGEIESRLTQCPDIREAVVIVREDTPGDKRLVAYIRMQPDTALTPARLRQQLAQDLAEYMIPSAFVMLETFPLTPNGKLDRKALPEPDQSAVITRDYAEPVGEVETVLAEIWQTLLGLEQVGRHDHFFELGGHSLMAVSLIEQLRSRGYTLAVRTVFTTPLLAEMAQEIQDRQEAPITSVPPNRVPDGSTAITPEMLPLVTLSQAEIDTVVATVIGGAANVQDIYPLSPLQEGILFHHQLQENRDTYLLNSLLAFDSRDRLDAFLGALQQVINRHDILRTAFCWQGLSQPVQVVWRQVTLPVMPFAPTSAENIPAQLQENVAPRMDIRQAPLFAALTAYDPDSDKWLLALNFHHLISDHMTLALIMAEIRSFLCGQAEVLPTPLPYRNFIAQTLSIPASVHEDYFRQRLTEIDEPTAPFGLLNIQGDGSDTTVARLSLDGNVAQAIRTQARAFGVSPSVLFHIACAQVLAHTSGRDDILFGTVLLGRLQGTVGADQVMGMFINTLPIRISFANLSVLAVVQATARDLAELLEHEQTPLALAQRCSHVLPPLPLFSALFNYRHSPSATAEQSGMDGVRLLAAEERTNYPLDLTVDDLGEDFILVAQTVTGIDPDRIVNYLYTALCGLTEALRTDPQLPLLALSILPASERQQLLEDFNATQTDFPPVALIHALFEQRALSAPETIAVITENSSLSYGDLNQRANQLAHSLIAIGIRPDDRVALCVERSVDMIIGLLGILKAGAAYVPLDPSHPDKRRAYVLSDSAPKLLLTQQHLQAFCAHTDIPVWLLDKADYLAQAAQYPITNPEPEQLGLQGHHLAYVIYTSGSTGMPKGVMVEHRNVINFIHAQCQITNLNATDRVLQFATVAFDASVAEIFPTLAIGATLILRPSHLQIPDADFSHFLQEQGVSVVDLPTAFWHQWGQEIKAGHAEFCPTLRAITVGGEKTDLRYLADWQSLPETQHCRWTDTYGPTEATVIATSLSLQDNFRPETLSIGRPIANTRLYVLDKQRQPVPIGVRGEIYIGGAGVARGYLNLPDLTAERFLSDPFSSRTGGRMYKTGDLGRWLPDGNIEYLGRNDFQVKIRGFRIELREIETQLLACEGIKDVVVVAREADNGEKCLVAYLVPQPDITVNTTDLREYLRTCLADYMLPSAFVVLDTFPLTPNGKLDRQALPEPDQLARVSRDYEPPQGETERLLVQVWQDLLGLERVGRHDHFFELGGHSLIAVRLLNSLNKQGITISLATLFSYPILCDLALAINRESVKPNSPLDDNPIPLSPEGNLLPLFLIHETTGDPLVYSLLAASLPEDLPVYILQALGLHTVENPPASIEELAACHIQAIRRVQPHGPYRLAGWSIGGVIAYEIALQLINSGETISYLGMIDSYNFSECKLDRQKDVQMLIQSLRDYREQINGDDSDKLYDFHDCEELQWLSEGIQKEDILLRLNTQEFILQLEQKYSISASSLPIHLYTCDDLAPGFDSWRGWHDIVGKHSILQPIGGGHYTIMQPPLINQLVDSITEHLLPGSSSPHKLLTDFAELK